MARNKYPEETRIKILETATRLFLEKGLEHTTIQDVVDELGGLSKGAIYHHFKNKEELFIEVCQHMFSKSTVREKILTVTKDPDLSAIEKFVQMAFVSISDPEEVAFRTMAPDVKKNPHMLSELMDRWINVDTPLFYQPIIDQGVKEGSIHTTYPKQLAELITLLVNIWLNPTLYPVPQEEFHDKLCFLFELLQKAGIDADLSPVLMTFLMQIPAQKPESKVAKEQNVNGSE